MAIVCKYIEPPTDTAQATEFIRDVVAPLIAKYWEKEERDICGKDLSFSVVPFIQMWLLDSLMIVVAYEDDVPIGIVLGTKFVPMFYQAKVLQIEAAYGPVSTIMDYILTIIGFMGITEIRSFPGWMPKNMWPMIRTRQIATYVKK